MRMVLNLALHPITAVMNQPSASRRRFLKTSAALTLGLPFLSGIFQSASAEEKTPDEGLLMIGPVTGYTPHIGTLVTMLNYNRSTIVRMVKELNRKQIDFLLDPKANTVAALLLHLASVEKFYQINTFEGRQEFNESEKKQWQIALDLGDKGREEIKGKDVSYYLGVLEEVRAHTLAELKKKDDRWLLAKDPEWSTPERAINTYWKWFHVCEHESNHRGQIAFLKSRLPGVKASDKD